jgi:phosphohistidine phosphatase
VGAILLMRHAEAAAETLVIRESHRYLTPEGRRQAAAVGQRLRECAPPIDALVVSPLMRAVQTAELVAAALGFPGAVEAFPALAPGGDAHAVADHLARHSGCLLAVGHEPGFSAIGALLCHRASFPPLHMAQVFLIQDSLPVWTLGPADASPVPVG